MRDMRIALCNGYEMKISENRKSGLQTKQGEEPDVLYMMPFTGIRCR